MRLVDHYHADVQHVEVGAEEAGGEALRREVEELEASVGGVVERGVHLPAVHAGVHRYRPYAPRLEVLHLVLHERDQRGDHEGKPVAHHRGHLEADGLAAAGGEYGQHVAPSEGGCNYLLLHGAEGLVAPVFLQCLERGHGRCKFKKFGGLARGLLWKRNKSLVNSHDLKDNKFNP